MKVPERYKVGITRYPPADADDLHTFQLRTFEAGTRQVDAARRPGCSTRTRAARPTPPGPVGVPA